MRVGIIGLINHDTIFMAGGRRIQDLGGILYNTTVMADLVDEDDALYPISRIGTDCYDAMRAILDPRPAVSNRGVRVSRTGTSRNRIRYDEEMEKVEQLTNHIGPIPFAQIEPFLDLDALLVNFIVGDDISLETMAAVRERATGLLYLDVHNLCLGIDAEGYRQRRAPGDWHRWIEMFDVVQMNEVEARLLAGVPGGLLETVDDFIAFGRSVIALGPSVCVITRGPLGPVTVYRKDRETRAIAIPSEPARDVVDTTGCGDAFAAGFVVEYAAMKDPIGATRLANRVASVNCTVAGLPNTGTFSDIRL
ncbi:MAG: PfkB family carbohydrate kinase [Gemmatimonadota bacterium]|nr:PfkB family carbohydrate kinase [Gemmatimonadota bacterium]